MHVYGFFALVVQEAEMPQQSTKELFRPVHPHVKHAATGSRFIITPLVHFSLSYVS